MADKEVRFWNWDNQSLTSAEVSALESLGGMHRCHLSDPMYLDYMSPELCAFCGYTTQDLVDGCRHGLYTRIIHPDDVDKFLSFCDDLAVKEDCKTIGYRIIKKNGTVASVYDTMVSKRDGNNEMWGLSVVVANESKEDNSQGDEDGVDFVHYGVVDASWSGVDTNHAEITFCNDFFLRLLGFSEEVVKADKAGVISAVNLVFGADVLSFIPSYATSETPCHAYGFLRKVDGSYVEVSCWVRLARSAEKSTCRLTILPTTRAANLNRAKNKAEFLEAMCSVYNLVFDADLLKGTVRCVHNALGGDYAFDPCDIPLELDMAASDLAERYFSEESRKQYDEEIAPLFEVGTRLSSQLALHRTYTALMHGKEEPIEMFLFRSEDYMLIMIGVKSEQSVRQEPEHHVFIRTFGYFEVFVDDKPIIFKHPKSRELFALLVDRQGGMVSSRTAASLLWDDKEPDDTVMARYRKIAMYLTESLDEAGVGCLVENVRGNRRANLSMAECDLVDYLRLGNKAPKTFGGAYMKEYSWAEQTLGELVFRSERI